VDVIDVIGRRGECVISVSDSGEFGLIARIVARLRPADSVLLGPGDDAAVIASPDGRTVVTTDVLVEGVHFRRDWSTAYDVGRKAAAQSLADVVAMGARPTAIVVGLAAPADLPLQWADDLVDGLQDECALTSAGLAGGDVVRSDVVTIAVTALGDLGGRAAVTRAGAEPGDVVVVAGHLGFAAAGLDLLREDRHEPAVLLAAHRAPTVPYDAGLLLADLGATSMIDVSDGLVGDLRHVARASGVLIELTAGALPVEPPLVDAASALGVDPLSWVAGGGEDHAFAATLPMVAARRAEELLADARVPFAQIGTVRDGDPDVAFTDRAPAVTNGHDHFA
jgi:thiamine-monophosphate kinase